LKNRTNRTKTIQKAYFTDKNSYL